MVMAYGYECGIYSSRKLEEACRYRVDFMWLLEDESVPDHTTFARFRTGRCTEAVEELFYQYVRLLHLWYLMRKGYPSALFIPLSEYVGKSKAKYYDGFTLVENNAGISGIMDVAPFVAYFSEEVYRKIGRSLPDIGTVEAFQAVLEEGNVTEKERALWAFVLTAYGSGEFSTKMLERDFGNAAYATIRAFVLKFEKLGLLSSVKYQNRTKYRAKV